MIANAITPRALLAATLVGAALARGAAAQERLVGFRTANVGLVWETVSFGSAGIAQSSAFGSGSIVKSASQWTIPMSLMIPLGDRWSVDAGAAFGSGEVTFVEPPEGVAGGASLSGLSDVRIRATGRVVGDELLFTLGLNAATGPRGLDPEEVAALGVLAAPALGLYLPSVSLGPSGTTGVVYSKPFGDWAWAAGLSYEVRGRFSPVAALSAGLPSPDFDPGDAIHLSIATDGLLGAHALNVSATADWYTEDQLLASGGGQPSTVQLGPTFGVDAQLRLASDRLRDVVIYVGDRFRSAFQREGERVAGSSANYLVAGARGGLPIARATELTLGLDAWRHSGLTVDNSLVTAETTAGALTLGLARRYGRYLLQPFVRARMGSVDTGVDDGTFTGLTGGLTLTTRF